jgi:hypothetical protein
MAMQIDTLNSRVKQMHFGHELQNTYANFAHLKWRGVLAGGDADAGAGFVIGPKEIRANWRYSCLIFPG